jgi:ABC-type phosphate/phosphonate transport system substrate-binding protein
MLTRAHPWWFGLSLVAVLTLAPTRADLILSAPPRERASEAQQIFEPLAELLSQATGETVVYAHASNWGLYQTRLTRGEYDLVLDGPHLVSWRIAHQQHEPLVALSGNLAFVVVAHKEDARIRKLSDIAGRMLCGYAPPNLATLTVFEQFRIAARQPQLVEVKGVNAAYQMLIKNKCRAAILPVEAYYELEGPSGRTKLVFRSKPYPNQALTAGPRVGPAQRDRILRALLAQNGQGPVARKVAGYFHADGFVPADTEQYRGYDRLLADTWGFDTASRRP